MQPAGADDRELQKMENRRVSLKDLAISESGLVFDPNTGSICTSNQTGLDILRALCEGKSTAEITETIAERYQVGAQLVEGDVRDFIQQLRSYGYTET